MHPQSIINTKELKLPEMLLIAGALFAMAAVGFFLAVFLQTRTASAPTYANLKQIAPEEKAKAMEGATAQNATTAKPVTASQADVNDSRAAAKLKVMQGSK